MLYHHYGVIVLQIRNEINSEWVYLDITADEQPFFLHGIAVDHSSGNVLLVDGADSKIYEFSSNDTGQSQNSGAVIHVVMSRGQVEPGNIPETFPPLPDYTSIILIPTMFAVIPASWAANVNFDSFTPGSKFPYFFINSFIEAPSFSNFFMLSCAGGGPWYGGFWPRYLASIQWE